MRRYTLNKYISRLMACLMALVLVLTISSAVRAEEAGSCGDGLSWSLSAGTLTITGSGDMTDFPDETMAPWYHLRKEILRLELPDTLTSIGSLAFYGCENLTAVVIPASVERIGDYAFAGCSGMELLNMGSSVTAIGEAAFSDCVKLAALRLPDGLQTIGNQAFYRCESISTVTVPATVTSLGVSAFSYCKKLVSADIRASVTTIPEFLFYGCERLVSVTLPDEMEQINKFTFRGCDQLTTIYYDGTEKTAEEIQELIDEDVPGFDTTGHVTDSTPSDSSPSSSGVTHENEDGSVTQENVSASESEDVTVTTTTETTRDEDGSGTSSSVEIDVTINGEEGWEEAIEAVEEALDDFTDNTAANDSEVEDVDVNVYVTGTDEISQEFVDAIVGRDVDVTITTEDGSVWRINGNQLDDTTMEGAYNLSYTLTEGSAELCAELETEKSYVLRFHATAQVNAEVLIRLGENMAMQNATLLQRDGDELNRFQTVVVDQSGFAHLYLGSVESDMEYYIAMNLPEEEAEAIVPAEMLSAYGNPENYTPIQYQITGRKSSWGITFGQVTWIMIGGLTACVVIVGFVMYTLNKRKLRMGYVPDLDEEDYE